MREGYKLSEFGEIPENWQVLKVMDISRVLTGNTPPTNESNNFNGSYPWVTPSDIIANKNITVTARTLSIQGIKIARFIPANSLLITCIASIGKNAILKKDGSCNQQINAIIPSSNHDTDFLYYYFESEKIRLFQMSTATPPLKA